MNVLQQYAQLARQGVRGENAAAIRAEVEQPSEMEWATPGGSWAKTAFV